MNFFHRSIFISVLALTSCPLLSQINVTALISDAQTDISKNNYLEAIKKLNICISVKPGESVAYFFRGLCKYYLNDNLGAEQDLTNALTIYNPWAYDAYNYRGLAKYRLQDFNGAIMDFNKVILKRPRDPQLYIERAFARLSNQDFKGSLSDCDKSLDLGAEGDNIYLCKGSAESGLEDYESALKDYVLALRFNPKNVDVFIRRGITKLKMGNNQDAISDFNLALKLDTVSTLAYFNRAEAEMAANDQDAALRDLNTILKYEPENSLVYFNKAFIEANQKEYKKAIKDFDKVLELNPQNIQALFNRAKLKTMVNDYKAALADYNQTIESFPYYVEAYYDRSEVKKHLKDFEGAKKDVELSKIISEMNQEKNLSQKNRDSLNLIRLMELDANFGSGETNSEDTVSIELMPVFAISVKDSNNIKSIFYSPLLLKLGTQSQPLCFSNKESKYKLNVSDSASEHHSLLLKAIYKTGLQLFNDAAKDYTKNIELNPKSAIAYFARGVNTCKEIGLIRQFDSKNLNEKYEKALLDFNKAIQLEPDFAFAYYNRAYVKCQLHDFNGSEKDCDSAIRANPDIADAYYNRGLLLLVLRNKLNACQNFSKASELGLIESYAIIKRYCSHIR